MPILTSKPKSPSLDKCKLVPYSIVFKIRGSDKHYQEALEASSSFNRRLLKDRKMRIPFIDSQTRVAQSNCSLWAMKFQRKNIQNNINIDHQDNNYQNSFNLDKNGYCYVYPNKKWLKHRRLVIDSNDTSLFPYAHLYRSQSQQNQHYQQQNELNMNENSNSIDSIALMSHHQYQQHQQQQQQQHHSTSSNPTIHQILTKQSSLSNDINDNHDNDPHHNQNTNTNNNNNISNINNYLALYKDYHEDSFDNFDNEDNDSEQDDYDEKKKKKKGKTKKKHGEITEKNDDKPFVCDRCGIKYKTKPGLTYHVQKAHSSSSSSTYIARNTETVQPDENTTTSVFESGCDDMNSTSSVTLNTKSVKCSICTGTENEAKFNQQEKCLTCSECNKSFHPICINISQTMVESIKKYNWQCIDCKKCTHCGNSENDDKLLFCDDCDRGYHMYCLKPPLQEAPDGDWRCELCVKN